MFSHHPKNLKLKNNSNYNRLFHAFLALNMAIVLFSCEYKTDEVFNKEIDKDKPQAPPQIVKLNLDEEYIALYGSKNVQFHFESEYDIMYVTFKLDDGEEEVTYFNQGSFYINYTGLEDGVHNLTMTVSTGSGNGSIAAQVKAEVYNYQYEWKLIVDSKYELDNEIIYENGLLRLNWAKYNNIDFKEYVLEVNDLDGLILQKHLLKENTFLFPSYFGQGLRCIIYVKTTNGETFKFTSIQVESTLYPINIKENELGHLELSWKKNPCFSGADSCVLYELSNNGFIRSIDRIKLANDTTYIVDELFYSQKLKYMLKYFSEMEEDYNQHYYGTSKEFNYEVPFSNTISFNSFTRANRDEFLFKYENYFAKYSITQGRIIDSIFVGEPYSVLFSESGKTAVIEKSNSQLIVNTQDLKIYSNATENLNKSYINLNTISDKLTIICSTDWGYGLFNLNTNSFSIHNVDGSYASLSPDGDVYISLENIYKVADTTISYNIPYYLGYKQFNPMNSNEIISWDGQTLNFLNLETLSTYKSLPLEHTSRIANIDFYNQELLTVDYDETLSVRDLNSGKLLKSLKIDPYTTNKNFLLMNHHLICENGTIIPFNLN